ncbi:aldehyde dehydrogenase family protein [Nocardia uniformis]|uniref:Aldehyde dehydrogenase n=1 Tax=Nocardia uniformis TaxID=53432 RepID=A0A849C4Z3_9NOCA|nr:aldehyde dehydrogenase family protein [Nocardia uniformis]NNH70877.1 aldehyde dehydrogenase family protein [Nocardia uniformis]
MDTELQSFDPATDEVVAVVPIMGLTEVTEVVRQAHEASSWWRAKGFKGRRARLLAWRRYMAQHAVEIIDLIHRENGKPRPDAALELMLSLEHIAWTAKNAAKILGPEKRRTGLLTANFAARVDHLPFGVVGVIGPWNYPLYTPNGSIATALASGNTVVFKPSEYTPAVAQWYADAFATANPEAPQGILSIVTGDGGTGRALCDAGVHKLAFTGSTATGKAVMAACATNLVPVVLELGGKDAAIVTADADIDAAAESIAFGAMGNAGQTCVGIERVYVDREVRDQFVAALERELADIRPGEREGSSYGPMTMPSQAEVVRNHVRAAINDGAAPLIGGLASIGDRFISPVVLLDPPHNSAAIQQETFGPTLTVTTVESVDDAVAQANDVALGLGGAVFAKRHGADIARRLDTGQVSINSVLGFAAIASLPLGGRGDSGFGRIHGPEGLREFTRPRALAIERFALPVNLLSLRRPEWVDRLLPRLIGWLHGR